METGLLCAKNIISLLTVLCIEMKNPTITVWLDQETEDKVAVGLTTTVAQENFLYSIPDICYSQLLHVWSKVDKRE